MKKLNRISIIVLLLLLAVNTAATTLSDVESFKVTINNKSKRYITIVDSINNKDQYLVFGPKDYVPINEIAALEIVGFIGDTQHVYNDYKTCTGEGPEKAACIVLELKRETQSSKALRDAVNLAKQRAETKNSELRQELKRHHDAQFQAEEKARWELERRRELKTEAEKWIRENRQRYQQLSKEHPYLFK